MPAKRDPDPLDTFFPPKPGTLPAVKDATIGEGPIGLGYPAVLNAWDRINHDHDPFQETRMHDTRVRMKDGRTFVGPIGMQRPLEGYFMVCAFDEGRTEPTRMDLAGVESAGPDDRDEMVRARRDGWTG